MKCLQKVRCWSPGTRVMLARSWYTEGRSAMISSLISRRVALRRGRSSAALDVDWGGDG